MKLLLIFLFLFSCAQKEEDSFDSDLKYNLIGSINFGNVRIGEYRYAELEISNNTNKTKQIQISEILTPFFIEENLCGSEISHDEKCRIKFKFEPSSNFTQSQVVNVNSYTFELSGKGLAQGEFSLNDNSWEIDDVVAGSAIVKSFIITNLGDIALDRPVLTEGDAIISNTNCEEKIPALSSCSIELTSQKTIVGNYNEIFKLKGVGSQEILINFTTNIIPSTPSGLITFKENIESVIANSADIKTIEIDQVSDEYGNIITDGYNVDSSAINLSIISSTNTPLISGSASFTIRSTSVIGNSQFFVTIGDASGIMNIYSSSGPSVGTINAKTFNNTLKADGFSSVIIETLPLVNSAGLVVDDGTEVFFEIVGSGTLSNSMSPTIAGVARTRVTSENIAETITLNILSNPIYNNLDEIIGYGSTGRVQIIFIPVDNLSQFNLLSDRDGIYFEKGTSFYIDEANITSETIRDEYNNPVGSGRTVSISLNNGLHSDLNTNSFDLITDSNSQISFPIKGISQRGFIEIQAISNNITSNLNVFATSEASLSFTSANNPLSLYHTFDNYNFNVNNLNPYNSIWKDHQEDFSSFLLRDSEYFGKKRFSYPTSDIFYNFFDFVDECIIPVKNYFFLAPCTKQVINNQALEYREEGLYKIEVHENNVSYDTNVEFPFYGDDILYNFFLGSSSIYDYTNDRIIKFGGLMLDDFGDFYSNFQSVNYLQASLFVFLPTQVGSVSYPYPIIPSISHGETSYIFGGANIDSSPVFEFGNSLYKFENGSFSEITISELALKPSARILSGMYQKENKLLLVGGVDINGNSLSDFWEYDLDLNQWTLICDSCFNITLSDPLININDIIANPTQDKVKDFVNLEKIQIIYDEIKESIFISKSNSSNVYKYNSVTNLFEEEYDFNIRTIFSGEKVYYNKQRKNYINFDNRTQGGGDSKVKFFEMNNSEIEYYLVKIQSDANAKNYAQRITPKISAWNQTIFDQNGQNIERYGVSSYIFNHTSNTWEFIDSNNHPVKNDIVNTTYDMSKDFESNVSDYFSNTGEIFILIKPDNVGELNGQSYNFSSELLINYLEINGIF